MEVSLKYSMFDFALTKKPCFLFVPDLDHYTNDERGMYIDFNTLPFPSGISIEDFFERIRKFNYTAYREKIEKYLESINNIERGEASFLIAKDIVNHIKETKQ